MCALQPLRAYLQKAAYIVDFLNSGSLESYELTFTNNVNNKHSDI